MSLSELYREARAQGASDYEIAKAIGLPARELEYRVRGRVREASEFAGGLAARPPNRSPSAHAWTLEQVRRARDEQLAGKFERPARLAEAMRTDDALFVAYHNRIAPQGAIPAALQPSREPSRNAAAVSKRAAQHVIATRPTLKGIHGTLVNHGIAVGYLTHEPNDAGTLVDFRLREWPLEHITWSDSRQTLEARTSDGTRETVTHADGRWVVFQKHGLRPWGQDACVLPGALLWAAHAYGLRDWMAGAQSHGQAKIVGELPEGVTLAQEDGSLSPEANAFLRMLNDIVSGTAGAGVRAAGAKTDFLANDSTAWQVFAELINNREKAAARIYLGTDASLGSVGGAPGVDISALFNVATTLIQGDFEAIEQGLNVGVYQPWAAVNYGDSRLAPRWRYLLPDPDEEQNRERAAKNAERVVAEVDALKKIGAVVDQDVLDAIAQRYGVTPPTLQERTEQAVPLALAPTDVAKVVKVREAREAQGLPPFGDERDELTLSELERLGKSEPQDPPAQGAPG